MGLGRGLGLGKGKVMKQDWADQGATEPGSRSTACASYALYVVNGGGLRIVPLPRAGSITIGRSERVDVVINDARVSRHHVRIHCGVGFLVEDLDSLSGTTIDGTRVAAGALEILAPGSAVKIGETMLVVLDATQDATAVDTRPAELTSARTRVISEGAARTTSARWTPHAGLGTQATRATSR
jgi:hypothetical protein